MKPLITIGIPVYNVEKYISECLSSVFSQTYENFEIIIVDDRGSDKSMTIVDNMIAKCNIKDSIKIIKQPYNMGLGMARNTIINNAHGDYLYFIDSDDVITSDCISYLYKKVSEQNLDFACCSMEETDESLKTTDKQIFETKYCPNNDSVLKFSFIDKHKMPLCYGWNKLYKVDFLRNNNISFTNGIFYEDSFFFLKLISHTNRCAFFDKDTYKYRQRLNSITNINPGTFREKEIKDMTYTLKLEKEYIKRYKRTDIYSDIILSYAKKSFFCLRSYINNNNGNINIKPYYKDLLYYPSCLIEILNFKNNIFQNLFFWFLNKIPYSIQKILICRL